MHNNEIVNTCLVDVIDLLVIPICAFCWSVNNCPQLDWFFPSSSPEPAMRRPSFIIIQWMTLVYSGHQFRKISHFALFCAKPNFAKFSVQISQTVKRLISGRVSRIFPAFFNFFLYFQKYNSWNIIYIFEFSKNNILIKMTENFSIF